MYTEILGNPTGKIFLATSREHEFLLIYKGNASNVLNNFNTSAKSNFVKNSINLIKIASPIPSDLSHPTNSDRNRDAQVEYLGIIKMVLRNCIKGINFTNPVQTRGYVEI